MLFTCFASVNQWPCIFFVDLVPFFTRGRFFEWPFQVSKNRFISNCSRHYKSGQFYHKNGKLLLLEIEETVIINRGSSHNNKSGQNYYKSEELQTITVWKDLSEIRVAIANRGICWKSMHSNIARSDHFVIEKLDWCGARKNFQKRNWSSLFLMVRLGMFLNALTTVFTFSLFWKRSSLHMFSLYNGFTNKHAITRKVSIHEKMGLLAMGTIC